MSNLLKRLAKRFRIKQFRTTAFHPQSNGSLERSHHVLGEYLKQFVAKNLSQQEKLQTYNGYLINFVTQLHEMRTQARENLISAKEKSKLYYDKKINPLEVKIGDNVFLLKGGKIKTLDSHYTGPYEILEV